ncbi:MAG: hypothetical protein ABJG68_04845 [Crocinitomicaceae bacterium]
MKEFISKHFLLSVYSFVLFILAFGLIAESGFTYVPFFGLYVVTFYLAYFAFSKYGANKGIHFFSRFSLSENNQKILSIGFTAFISIVVIYHLYLLGGCPPLQAYGEHTANELAEIRRNLTENSSTLMNYASSFTIKALLPFFLLYFYLKKKKILFIILFVLGSFYAFSLMQKSYIIAILIPLVVYLLLERKWLFVLANTVYIVFVVGIMVYITNPDLAEKPIPLEDTTEFADAIEETQRKPPGSPVLRIAYGLYERTMLVPGEIVSKWFKVIPEKRPFLYGNGYRIVAKLKGEEFVNYTADLYPLVRPSFAKRGLKGNVNVASFMYEYSNFGTIGLIISGIILAFVFLVIEKIFAAQTKLNMSINAFPVLILSSGALNTLLFSGGWGLSILLFILFLGKKNESDEAH